jgi:hypothetical protein
MQRSGVSRLKLLGRHCSKAERAAQGRSQRRGQRRRARLCANTAIASPKARGRFAARGRTPPPSGLPSVVTSRRAVEAVVIMPKRRPTIPIAHADDVPTIAFTNEQWQAIEHAYARQLNADVRQQITTVTTQYLKDCAFERTVAPKAMARERIERIRRAAGDLEKVMLDSKPFSASSDELSREQQQSAHSYADGLIRRHLDERRSRLLAVVTVTDGDGNTATTSTGIGDAVFFQLFQDDGPTAAIVQGAATVAHDETAGNQADADDTTDPAVAALFAGVSNVSSDLSPTGFAQDATPVVSSTGSAFGADQVGGTTAFSLAVSAAGVDSGLDTTGGQNILLFKEGDLVVGRIGGAAGAAAFAVAINSTSGVVSVAQYASIKHPTPGARDKLHHFRHALKSLVVACDCALGHLSATENCDDEPWNWWIQGLTQIVQEHGLPADARIVDTSGNLSPFGALVRALQEQEHVPARHMHSDEALAKAIQRAQRRARDK